MSKNKKIIFSALFLLISIFSLFIYYEWGKSVTEGYFTINEKQMIEKDGEFFLKLMLSDSEGYYLIDVKIKEDDFKKIIPGDKYDMVINWNNRFHSKSYVEEIHF